MLATEGFFNPPRMNPRSCTMSPLPIPTCRSPSEVRTPELATAGAGSLCPRSLDTRAPYPDDLSTPGSWGSFAPVCSARGWQQQIVGATRAKRGCGGGQKPGGASTCMSIHRETAGQVNWAARAAVWTRTVARLYPQAPARRPCSVMTAKPTRARAAFTPRSKRADRDTY
jgi:hypothetical protein